MDFFLSWSGIHELSCFLWGRDPTYSHSPKPEALSRTVLSFFLWETQRNSDLFCRTPRSSRGMYPSTSSGDYWQLHTKTQVCRLPCILGLSNPYNQDSLGLTSKVHCSAKAPFPPLRFTRVMVYYHTVTHKHTATRSNCQLVVSLWAAEAHWCQLLLSHTAPNCSTLQHTAAHCSTLQHTAAHCSTL